MCWLVDDLDLLKNIEGTMSIFIAVHQLSRCCNIISLIPNKSDCARPVQILRGRIAQRRLLSRSFQDLARSWRE
jgi:hypothetical protein